MKARSTNRRAEKGLFIIVVVAALFAILAILGLAIDAANLFRARIRVQKATDAGAVAGSLMLTQSPQPVGVTPEGYAGTVALTNLRSSGIINPRITGATRWTSGNYTGITVSATAQAPLIFLRMVPFIHGINNVSAVSYSETGRVSAAISLVLDTSGSMSCPASGACPTSCVTNPSRSQCHPSKLDKLKEAATNFFNQFDESIDYISLIRFSDTNTFPSGNGAQVLFPMGHFNKSYLTNDSRHGLASITQASGATNIEGGIQAGSAQLASPVIDASARKYLVLITDGAPTDSSNAGVCRAANGAKADYVRTINAADSARQNGATIHSIGLGAVNGSNPHDPYENVNDQSSLKPVLLHRVTNSAEAQNDPNFDCVQDYTQYNQRNPSPAKGTYLETPDANDLISFLQSIAQSILRQVRLVAGQR